MLKINPFKTVGHCFVDEPLDLGFDRSRSLLDPPSGALHPVTEENHSSTQQPFATHFQPKDYHGSSAPYR